MNRLLPCILLALTLAGCGASPLGILTGGGPNIAANVQAGKTNTQTLGLTQNTEQRLVRPQARSIEQSAGKTGVRAEVVRDVHVSNIEPWLIGLLCLFAGFLIPSHREIRLRVQQWRTKKKTPREA